MGRMDYKCGFCQRRFGSRHVLLPHLNVYHPKEGARTRWELIEMTPTRDEDDLVMIDSMFKELIAIEQLPYELVATPANKIQNAKERGKNSDEAEVEVAVAVGQPSEQNNIEKENTGEFEKPAERRKVKLLVDMQFTSKNKPAGYQLFYQTIALWIGCRTQSVGADNHFYILDKWEKLSNSTKALWAFEESAIKTIRYLEHATKQLNAYGDGPEQMTMEYSTKFEPLPDHLFSEGFEDSDTYCGFTKGCVVNVDLGDRRKSD